MSVYTDKKPEWIILAFCIAILCRLGGCSGNEENKWSPKERLDTLEEKIDILLERK